MVVHRREKGSQLIEFALVAPVLLLLLIGIVEFSWMFHKQIQIDNAVRLGARRAAVGVDNLTIIDQMKNVCSFPVADEQITIEVRTPDGVPIEDPEDRTPDNLVYVAIDLPASFILWGGQINLCAEAEFVVE